MDIEGLAKSRKDTIWVKKKTLECVLQQCQMALQQLADGCDDDDRDEESSNNEASASQESSDASTTPASADSETREFYSLLKSRVECDDFLDKLEGAQALHQEHRTEENSSWDIVNNNDIWEIGNADQNPDDFVLVKQEDIIDGIASFMAEYLASLKETKELTPNQLQAALSKTFSTKKRKGKLQKAWEGGKVIYNVASWGATAIGIYQNPALLQAASTAFWTSCHVISKLF